MTKTLNIKTLIALIWLILASCGREAEPESPGICDQKVMINKGQYKNGPSDLLTIQKAEISGDCLTIRFGASGCDGKSWEVRLIDSGEVLYSDPPQRNIRLSLRNKEMCEAYLTREISFDISDLQVNGNKLLLNLSNSGTQIAYSY